MNRHKPHVYVIPEDDANRQLVNGFIDYHEVDSRRIQVMPLADGWSHVLEKFTKDYVKRLRENRDAHVVLMIDYDGKFEDRRARFDAAIPDDLKARVFVFGTLRTPETLRRELGRTFEQIGRTLAEECYTNTAVAWDQEQLRHNAADRQRSLLTIRPILFP